MIAQGGLALPGRCPGGVHEASPCTSCTHACAAVPAGATFIGIVQAARPGQRWPSRRALRVGRALVHALRSTRSCCRVRMPESLLAAQRGEACPSAARLRPAASASKRPAPTYLLPSAARPVLAFLFVRGARLPLASFRAPDLTARRCAWQVRALTAPLPLLGGADLDGDEQVRSGELEPAAPAGMSILAFALAPPPPSCPGMPWLLPTLHNPCVCERAAACASRRHSMSG